ncbi:MAG: trans-aconitate 2-methyltransferase [Microbacteriaceae bacterium]|nr:MAG: trans-aconitate 2-methyltransferase [Microbacteriaceae bacterium]
MQWDPALYGAYANERAQPFFDLTARIGVVAPRQVVDLGCGPGTLTRTLAERWPAARIHGIDSSPHMVNRANEAVTDPSRVCFELSDLAAWMPDETTDVVVSNAALQWVPEHEELLSAWGAALPDGAWLAFQVPGNFAAPSHRLMRELAASERWRWRLDGVLRPERPVREPADYLQLLIGLGFTTVAWETTYLHVLAGEDPVLAWVRGTGLRPALQALPPSVVPEFEAEYARLLRQAYPQTPFGTVYPFRRIFVVGVKGGPPAS